MTFKSVVVTIAIVILILSLIVLGIIIYNSRNNDQFPPEIGNCPDYFVMKQKICWWRYRRYIYRNVLQPA